MTQPKLKTLHKLIAQFQSEMRTGALFIEPDSKPKEADEEKYGAEVVGLVAYWIKRMID